MQQIIRAALDDGRSVLFEHEVLDLLAAQGVRVPTYVFVSLDRLDQPWPPLAGDVVIKVVSPVILHKSDVGGVKLVRAGADRLAAARAMLAGLPADLRDTVRGVLIEQAMPHQPGPGRELLVGTRRTEAFGPILTVGFGGTAVEALGAVAPPVLFAADLPAVARDAKVDTALMARWVTGGIRGVEALQSPADLHADLARWVAAFDAICASVEAEGAVVDELELNPVVWSDGWIPVDGLLRLGRPVAARPAVPRPQLRRALSPERVAIMGVSARPTMGRIILETMLAAGFPDDHLFPIHPRLDEVAGVPCVRAIADLPEPIDVLVVAVGAEAVPGLLAESIASGKVGALLLIPGGMGETEGGKGLAAEVQLLVAEADPDTRPVLLGNNSLGLVSRRAHLDSLFIPQAKLLRAERGSGVALISQSGAFAITRMSKLADLGLDYLASIGNQLDACASDVLEVLAEDESVRTFALYAEGLQPGDGVRLLAQIRLLRAQGRDVIVYKGGRSGLGQAAAAGHTASVAGDYRVFSELLTDAGALVAEDFEEFLDLVRLSVGLRARTVRGRRVAMLSNAGYESVGMADRVSQAGLQAATLADATRVAIVAALDEARISALVSIANPLDVTPMANDAVYEAVTRAFLDDPGVDAAVIANVPLTPQLQTLPAGLLPGEAFRVEHGFAARTVRAFRDSDKPLVVVIDSGPLYDPLADHIQAAGVPVMRSADRAVLLLGRYLSARMG